MKTSQGLFEPVLAASLAGGTFYRENGEILQALGIALVGGALGWLGKTLMKYLFNCIKRKWNERKE